MGADLNAAATGGVTALHVAAEAGHDSIVSILLKVRGSLTCTLGKAPFLIPFITPITVDKM